MKTLDVKTVMVNLFEADGKTYLSVSRLQKLFEYIYNELSKSGSLKNYDVIFDTGFDSIERTISYNNNLFDLDDDGDIIYLLDTNVHTLTALYKADDEVIRIISRFAAEHPA